jgi:hypothetical protein
MPEFFTDPDEIRIHSLITEPTATNKLVFDPITEIGKKEWESIEDTINNHRRFREMSAAVKWLVGIKIARPERLPEFPISQDEKEQILGEVQSPITRFRNTKTFDQRLEELADAKILLGNEFNVEAFDEFQVRDEIQAIINEQRPNGWYEAIKLAVCSKILFGPEFASDLVASGPLEKALNYAEQIREPIKLDSYTEILAWIRLAAPAELESKVKWSADWKKIQRDIDIANANMTEPSDPTLSGEYMPIVGYATIIAAQRVWIDNDGLHVQLEEYKSDDTTPPQPEPRRF